MGRLRAVLPGHHFQEASFWREDGRGVRAVQQVASRHASPLWLLAALSLVGWLIVNLDTAARRWILCDNGRERCGLTDDAGRP
jgi:hypothetical protein